MSTATTSRPRSTSTAALRGPEPRPAHVIPPDRRGTLTAPCDLCAHVRTVQFDDGLCTPCRWQQEMAAQKDREQDRLRRAVRMLEELDARGETL